MTTRSSRVALRCLIGWVLASLACIGAHAQLARENGHPIERGGLADLSGGLVLDATVTVLGHEFFDAFSSAWRELDVAQRYTIAISEVPNARFGSTLRVTSKGTVIYHGPLRPNRQAARDLAFVLAGEAFQALLRAEAEQALFRDADLAPEELR